jgi:UTP--glucose-1-phosphate uridylyltransferase
MPSRTAALDQHQLTENAQAFENTSTNVAAAQMRNALTNLAETVKDPEQKKVSLQFLAIFS